MHTTLDALALPHVRALCAALDAGNDDALVLALLADALEEAGDARAAGLRRGPWYLVHHVAEEGDLCPWASAWAVPDLQDGGKRTAALVALGGVITLLYGIGGVVTFPTRSAAFLALAQALTA